jgi:C_GCAxxG_C_C family probable redox protein
MTTPAEAAVSTFSQSYNCSQSVFSAFAVQFGMDRDLALKLASPFGGGVGGRGEVCGAVSGALLALGMKRGASTPPGKQEINRLSQEFMRMFEVKHGSILCRELIDLDRSTTEGWEQVRLSGKFESLCPLLVGDAAKLLQDLLDNA